MSIIAEYVWLDADNNFRSKIRILGLNDNNKWNYDGSSTGQATTESSEIILIPVKIFEHPFLEYNNLKFEKKLFICATYDINNNPLPNNYYHNAN